MPSPEPTDDPPARPADDPPARPADDPPVRAPGDPPARPVGPADRPPAATDGPAAAAEAAWSERPLDPRDYSRRTHLANERTYLAWWRTGLTALAAALAAARVVPELSGAQDRWPYTLLGAACAVAGVLAIAYGHRRRIAVEEGLMDGTFPPVDRRVTGIITGLGLAIGTGMLILIVLET